MIFQKNFILSRKQIENQIKSDKEYIDQEDYNLDSDSENTYKVRLIKQFPIIDIFLSQLKGNLQQQAVLLLAELLQIIHCPEGSVLLTENERDENLVFLVSGKINVLVKQNKYELYDEKILNCKLKQNQDQIAQILKSGVDQSNQLTQLKEENNRLISEIKQKCDPKSFELLSRDALRQSNYILNFIQGTYFLLQKKGVVSQGSIYGNLWTPETDKLSENVLIALEQSKLLVMRKEHFFQIFQQVIQKRNESLVAFRNLKGSYLNEENLKIYHYNVSENDDTSISPQLLLSFKEGYIPFSSPQQNLYNIGDDLDNIYIILEGEISLSFNPPHQSDHKIFNLDDQRDQISLQQKFSIFGFEDAFISKKRSFRAQIVQNNPENNAQIEGLRFLYLETNLFQKYTSQNLFELLKSETNRRINTLLVKPPQFSNHSFMFQLKSEEKFTQQKSLQSHFSANPLVPSIKIDNFKSSMDYLIKSHLGINNKEIDQEYNKRLKIQSNEDRIYQDDNQKQNIVFMNRHNNSTQSNAFIPKNQVKQNNTTIEKQRQKQLVAVSAANSQDQKSPLNLEEEIKQIKQRSYSVNTIKNQKSNQKHNFSVISLLDDQSKNSVAKKTQKKEFQIGLELEIEKKLKRSPDSSRSTQGQRLVILNEDKTSSPEKPLPNQLPESDDEDKTIFRPKIQRVDLELSNDGANKNSSLVTKLIGGKFRESYSKKLSQHPLQPAEQYQYQWQRNNSENSLNKEMMNLSVEMEKRLQLENSHANILPNQTVNQEQQASIMLQPNYHKRQSMKDSMDNTTSTIGRFPQRSRSTLTSWIKRQETRDFLLGNKKQVSPVDFGNVGQFFEQFSRQNPSEYDMQLINSLKYYKLTAAKRNSNQGFAISNGKVPNSKQIEQSFVKDEFDEYCDYLKSKNYHKNKLRQSSYENHTSINERKQMARNQQFLSAQNLINDSFPKEMEHKDYNSQFTSKQRAIRKIQSQSHFGSHNASPSSDKLNHGFGDQFSEKDEVNVNNNSFQPLQQQFYSSFTKNFFIHNMVSQQAIKNQTERTNYKEVHKSFNSKPGVGQIMSVLDYMVNNDPSNSSRALDEGQGGRVIQNNVILNNSADFVVKKFIDRQKSESLKQN